MTSVREKHKGGRVYKDTFLNHAIMYFFHCIMYTSEYNKTIYNKKYIYSYMKKISMILKKKK